MRRPNVKRAISALLFASVVASFGCVRATGDYDGIGFAPTATAFAVADRHDLEARNGTVIALLRPESERRLTLVFTGAEADPNDDWQRLPIGRLLELKRRLATRDGVLVTGLRLDEVKAGAEFPVAIAAPGAYAADTFAVGVVVDADVALAREERGLGSKIDFKLIIDDADPKAGGFIEGRLELTRNRAVNQSGLVATGEVAVDFRIPVVAERLGKANLAHLLPIMRCAAMAGPVAGAACHDEPPLPYLDATGLVIGN